MNNSSDAYTDNKKPWKQIWVILLLQLFMIPSLHAQLSVNIKQKSIKQALRVIEKQSNYRFIYHAQLHDLDKIVNVETSNQSIDHVMTQLLNGTRIGYEKRPNNQIVLVSAPVKNGANSPAGPVQKINGTVSDEKGEPIIGANVSIKGTTVGAISDVNGKFELDAAQGSTLLISYIGCTPKEIDVTTQSSYHISLSEDMKNLEEVVVVGYGTQKKVNLTGAVSSVAMSEVVESRPITNISNGLAGLMPGVQITSGSNAPGQGNASIMIRGQGTLNNSAPLVIIDGVEGNIGSVSPHDIESISALKDASSSAIYGSRAANGVILITTKQGEKGKFVVNYNGYLSIENVNRVSSLEPVSDYATYMTLMDEAFGNSNKTKPFSDTQIELWAKNRGGDTLKYPNTNWIDDVFKTSYSQNHDISISGGGDRVKFFTSFGYLDNPGIIERAGYKRYSIRGNIEGEIRKWLTVGLQTNGYVGLTDAGTSRLSNVWSYATVSTPGMVLRSPDGRYGSVNNPEDDPQSNNVLYLLNSILGEYVVRNNRTRAYVNLTPFNGFSLKASYLYEITDTQRDTKPIHLDRWNFLAESVSNAPGRTSIAEYNAKSNRYFMDIVARYDKKLTDKLMMNALAGASEEKATSWTLSASRYDLVDPSMWGLSAATGESTTSGGMSEWVMRSFFGRLNLDWDDKYLLELNLRSDGSSRFRPNKRWGYFPSASVGWRIEQEKFMQALKWDWLSQLKLRASFGSLGNNAVGNYDSQSVLGSANFTSQHDTGWMFNNQTNYILNNMLATGMAINSISNAAMTWETTYVTNIGIDMALFKNKLTASLEYFNKNTKGILIDLPVPLVVGNASIPQQNTAQVINNGVEFQFGWKDNIGAFKYYINANCTYVKNNVAKFKGDTPSIDGASMIKEGLPINSIYVLEVDRIVNTQADLALIQSMVDNTPAGKVTFAYGRPSLGDILYKDNNHDGLINDNDRRNFGQGSNPTFLYGATLGGSWKGLDFSVLLQGVQGNQVHYKNLYYSPLARYGNLLNQSIVDGRWYEGRTDEAKFPRLLEFADKRNDQNSNMWITDKSYFKIRNIQLGYTFKNRFLDKATIKKLRIYGSMENFFTFTNYVGIDPEVSGFTYPTMKQVSFGINLTF